MDKEEEKKEEKKKMKIESLSDAVDLNAINFRNKDVKIWSERKKNKNKATDTPTLSGLAGLGGASASRFRKRKK